MADGRIESTDKSTWGPLRVPPVSSRTASSTIQSQLDAGRDNISLSRDQATEIVLSLANCRDNEAKLESTSAELQRYRYYAQLGDYAGRLVDRVVKAAPKRKDIPTTVSKLQRALTEEMSSKPFVGGKVYDALDSAIKALSKQGLIVDFDMVQLAINAYSERNKVLHSELRSPEVADDLDKISERVSEDQERLRSVLPDDQQHHVEPWRRILGFYYASQKKDFDEHTRRKLREHVGSTSRQVPSGSWKDAFDRGQFRKHLEKEPELVESRPPPPRRQTDPTSGVCLKRKASAFPKPDSTDDAGQARGKPRTKLDEAEEDASEESETRLKRLLDEWHSKEPRQALRWAKGLVKELQRR